MTLDEAMKQFHGEWTPDGFAVIQYKDGYYWRIAQKVGDKVEITRDGKRILGVVEVANVSAGKVELPKKGKKQLAAPVANDLDDLDDLDL